MTDVTEREREQFRAVIDYWHLILPHVANAAINQGLGSAGQVLFCLVAQAVSLAGQNGLSPDAIRAGVETGLRDAARVEERRRD